MGKMYYNVQGEINITHQERWREWPCEAAATIAE